MVEVIVAVLAVSAYTEQVLTALKETPPDMIQLGNEINPGFLVTKSNAATIDDFAQISCSSYKSEETADNFNRVFSSAAATVRKLCPNAKIMVHLASSKGESLEWWFQKIKKIYPELLPPVSKNRYVALLLAILSHEKRRHGAEFVKRKSFKKNFFQLALHHAKVLNPESRSTASLETL